MASVTPCASCVFGAAPTALLSYPLNVVGSLDVFVFTNTVTFRNGSISTDVVTSTAGGSSGQTSFFMGSSGLSSAVNPIIISESTPTWETFGTTLTYPTTYVQYLGFQGAAATPPATACAQNLPLSTLSLPASTTAASFIYPQDNVTALPAGLLAYLEADGSIPEQLAGDELSGCAPLSVAIIAVGSTSSTTASVTEISSSATAVTTSSVITATSLSTSTETSTGSTTITATTSPTGSESSSSVVSTVVEPTTVTSATAVKVTSERIVATTQTQTQQVALLVNTIQGRTVVPEASTTATPLGVSLDESSTTETTILSTANSTAVLASTESAESAESAESSDTTITSSMVTTTIVMTTVTSPTSSLVMPLVPIPISSFSRPYTNGNSSIDSSGFPSGTIAGNATGTFSPFPYTGAANRVGRAPALGSLFGIFLAAVNL